MRSIKALILFISLAFISACKMTSEVDMNINLAADDESLVVSEFDPSDENTYNAATGFQILDSELKEHQGKLYFVKGNQSLNTWAMFFFVDGQPVPINGGNAELSEQNIPAYAELIFDSSGNLAGTIPAEFVSIPLGNPADTTSGLGANISTFDQGQDANQTVTIDVQNNQPTQYVYPFYATFDPHLISSAPSPTRQLEIGVNLPQDALALDINLFNASQPNTYTGLAEIDFFDSLGGLHEAVLFFVKNQAQANSWALFIYVDGEPLPVDGGISDSVFPARWPAYALLRFDSEGAFLSASPAAIRTVELGDASMTPSGTGAGVSTFTIGQDPSQVIRVELMEELVSQTSGSFEVLELVQDGRPAR